MTSLKVNAAEKHPHSMMLPPPRFTVGMVQGFLQIHAKVFYLVFIRPETLVSHLRESLGVFFVNSKRAVMCLLLRRGFCLVTLLYRPDWWSAAEMVVLLEGSPISTEELWSSVRVTIGFLVTSLIAQFGLGDSSRKSLGGSKPLPFKNDGGHNSFNLMAWFLL